MDLDLVLGLSAVLIGLALAAFSAPLARGLREGDERWRRQHPWTAAYEPQGRWTASDRGRLLFLRVWLLSCSAGFVLVGLGLALLR